MRYGKGEIPLLFGTAVASIAKFLHNPNLRFLTDIGIPFAYGKWQLNGFGYECATAGNRTVHWNHVLYVGAAVSVQSERLVTVSLAARQ